MIRVTDLKQYVYCPRVIFYTYCMPVRKKTTFKMDLGTELHAVIEQLERRRKLKKYGLERGERLFEQWMTSERLGLSGKLDMLILCENEQIPVDFKHTWGRTRRNHVVQLAGYALLVEETFGGSVEQGFIYLIPAEDAVVVSLDRALKDDVRSKIGEIEDVIAAERMPDPTPYRSKCYECEYLNFCNDIF